MGVRTFQFKVRPNARQSRLAPPAAEGEPWTAQLKSPPIDGRANKELIALVARHFGCAKSAVCLKAGTSDRLKLVQVDDD